MKRVRCPKCDHYIIFDDSQYTAGQSLVFQCTECGREFGIRIGVSKLKKTQKDENADLADDNGERSAEEAPCGSIVVIENVFHYKQIIPHCTITVSRDKRGGLRYTLSDNNSNTGTFVDNVELMPRERRLIDDGTLFTLGATSIILRTKEAEEE